MKNFLLSMLIFFGLLTQTISAQSVRNNQQIRKILPGYRSNFFSNSELTGKNQQSIFRRDNKVFPKSRTSNFANPAFKGNNFRVSDVFRQNKNIRNGTFATQGKGTNNKFKNQPTYQQEIPQELKDFINR